MGVCMPRGGRERNEAMIGTDNGGARATEQEEVKEDGGDGNDTEESEQQYGEGGDEGG